MENFKITLEGNYLKSVYCVYIIELQHQSDEPLFYIGQTGDNAHKTARPAFRRLVGHLDNLNSSTQNQIYKHIAKKLLGKRDTSLKYTSTEKAIIEKYFSESVLTMHVYPLENFDYDSTKEEHKRKRQSAQSFEKQVIQLFIKNEKKLQLMNKQIVSPKNNIIYMTQFKAIQKDFDLVKN
jgi:hypothetical protein